VIALKLKMGNTICGNSFWNVHKLYPYPVHNCKCSRHSWICKQRVLTAKF
jgi:hypothetical protein